MTNQTLTDKINAAQNFKIAGNKHFQQAHYKEALKNYHSVLLYISGLDTVNLPTASNHVSLSADEKVVVDGLFQSTWSNMSACYLKLDNPQKAIVYCNKVLEKAAQNSKALFRRAQAQHALNNLEKAYVDLVAAAKLAPNDVGIRKELDDIKKKKSVLDEKSKEELIKNFSKPGMFER